MLDKILEFFNIKSQSEYNEANQCLQNKVDNGKNLIVEEIDLFCNSRSISQIRNYSFCDDHRFRFLFLQHFSGLNTEARNKKDLESFAESWKNSVVDNPKSSLEQYTSKETRIEFQNISNEDGVLSRAKELEVLYLSKFIYLKVDRFFREYGAREIMIPLNGEHLLFNEFSYTHIAFRHYAKGVKQHTSDKSFFTRDIPIEMIVNRLQNIIEKIDNIGVYKGQNITSINFKFRGVLYRLATKPKPLIRQQSGGVKLELYRINTFHPLEREEDLRNIRDNYTPYKINNSLHVYRII